MAGFLFSVFFFFFGFLSNLAAQQVRLENYFPKLSPFDKPLGIVSAPGLKGKLFIAEQRGLIYQVEDNPETSKRMVFLDLSQLVSQSGWETGLLGIAFHPRFTENGRFFVSYTTDKTKELISCIAEFQADPKTLVVKNQEPKLIITQKQPYRNHNGGAIVFGPDGYLYFSWGDGGSAGDPKNNSQNLKTRLGKILRIDVDKSENGMPYAIPKDNPFVKTNGAMPEIFAYGLRNVWQMSFDFQTGKLWAGDVGQNAFEEIDIIKAGKNYGWRAYEAESVYKSGEERDSEKPVVFYDQKNEDKSVTGGLVYRGKQKEWKGWYFYADYISGRIWKFHEGEMKNELMLELRSPRVNVSCFGENGEKDLLIASHEEGIIYKLIP
jgi:glucose/arabinose dehydrogenase